MIMKYLDIYISIFYEDGNGMLFNLIVLIYDVRFFKNDSRL